MGSLLDDLEKINQIDQRGMLSVISSLPESAEDAIVLAENVKLNVRRFRNLVIVGLGGSARAAEFEHVAAKTRLFMEIIKPCFGKVLEVEAIGEGRLARMLSALYVGDFVSAYLGLLYGKDPSTVESIDRLKRG